MGWQENRDLELRHDGPIPRKKLIKVHMPHVKLTQAELDGHLANARQRLHSAFVKVKWTGRVKRGVRTGTALTDYPLVHNHLEAVREALSCRKYRDYWLTRIRAGEDDD